jgi:predicted transposase YbfD/YdcC
MSEGFGARSESKKTVAKVSKLRSAVDAESVQAQWLYQFQSLKDPRKPKGIEHNFLSIVLIAILATIGGAAGWEDIELYAESHQTWLATFLDLKHGVPHADTYRRVFALIPPDALQECFLGWVKQIVEATGAQVISIDGKTLKGSYDRGTRQSALHMVSAWASKNRLMLGQVKVESKTNEIKAIPALLKLLDITGCIITIDAMGTQTKIATQIVDKGADYVLCLKANHPTLWNQVRIWFEQAQLEHFKGIEHSYDPRVEGGHHRREIRKVWAVPIAQMGVLHEISQWTGLNTIVMVSRVRRLWNKTTREVMFYLSSLPCDAQAIGHAIRAHWGIENQLHWVLDVTFKEDASRIRKGHGAENFSLLRRMAIGLLNHEKSTKRSLKQKTKRAAMSPDYMIDVLMAAMNPQHFL